jgi:murein DD-endopeptidase MepM/ murein hydrolase activator NlpD
MGGIELRERKTGKTPKRDEFTRLTFLQAGLCVLISAALLASMYLKPDLFVRFKSDFAALNENDYGQDPVRFFDIGSNFEKREDALSEPSSEETTALEPPAAEAQSAVPEPETEAPESAFVPSSALTPMALSTDGSPVLPVSGSVTSGYGARVHPISGDDSFHGGVDIGADEGEPVVAVLDGTVAAAGAGEMSGNYVRLRHADGRETFYCHLSRIAVVSGMRVQKGDVIGYVGHTGIATGPHLHFELRINGEKTDPTPLLSEASDAAALR